MRRLGAGLGAGLVLITTACNTTTPGTTAPPPTIPVESRVPAIADTEEDTPVVAGTQPRDGNRIYAGAGTLPDGSFVDVPLPARPIWIAGVPLDSGTGWVVVLGDGRTMTFTVADGTASDPDEVPVPLPGGMPPVAVATPDGPVPAAPADEHAAPLSPPLIGDDGVWWISVEGSVIHDPGTGPIEYPFSVLTDARLVAAEDGRIAVLTDPTDRYPHGVLGDDLEATSIAMIDPGSGVTILSPPPGPVIEGLSPMWVDADGDGDLEILVTLSDAEGGARIALVDRDGEWIEGPPVGRGSRWRHQIGVGPVGPAGETEIVVVRTPHLGGIVEFYRHTDAGPEIVATVTGLTSHVLGSRNLDLALIADADGDGALEVVAPTQDRQWLAGVRRTDTGAVVGWQVPLEGTLVTNLAAITRNDELWLAAGREDAVRIWGG